MQQDCQSDDLECVNLECSLKTDTNRIPLRDIGIQTSLHYVEKKNASTSIDQSHVPVKAKTSKILARNCKIAHAHCLKRINLKFWPAVGDQCSNNNEPCSDLAHSVCVQGQCLCQKGYYEKDEICKAGTFPVISSYV